MSWNRFYPSGGGILKTGSKKVEFIFNKKNNKLIEEADEIPMGIKPLGWKHYLETFFWFETKWNPNNSAYAKYAKDFPLQLICERVHQSMSATQMMPWLSEISV